MKKYISSLIVLVSGMVFSQTILNASSPEEFRQMRAENKQKIGDSIVDNTITPLEYGFIEEKDILKSMFVWEVIDMNDKINQPFYYNDTSGLSSSENKSLYQLLLDAALNGEIEEVYDDENFQTKISPAGIKARLESTRLDDSAIDILNSGRQLTEQEKIELTDIIRTTSDKVKVLKIMGMWYVDKRDGMMKYRPLGIAAMGPDPAVQGRIVDGQLMAGADELIDLFWVYYPSARKILANSAVFNRKNTSSDLSFDDLINARRFTSIIYKSSAGLGDGTIKDYIPRNADEQIEESEKIKGEILQMENEMWNY
ncbi:gliding motility protein GldN [Chryseobacterium sp.]|uniref:type IX secretion system ring protein PorN/GldN n=1 Tax=Chryseobacterium sp. TaxID=1871047 RepID=UPI0011C92BE3|nr:gliding motility protein GldN [Chryseobacterium sp.]TXF75091.1 gliding motility protein GldN [Chryseobacterium sp.]